jgi:hypothetical protein
MKPSWAYLGALLIAIILIAAIPWLSIGLISAKWGAPGSACPSRILFYSAW